MNLVFFILVGTALEMIVAWQLYRGVRDQEFVFPGKVGSVRRITLKDDPIHYKWAVSWCAILILIIAAVLVFGITVIQN
jgi:hypothetical protein